MDAWTLLQLADSALPTGGFAHSAGLESACQLGRVDGSEALERFLAETLAQTGSLSLPFVRAAHAAPGAIAPLDLRYDAATPGHVANRSSRSQGAAFLRIAAHLSPAVADLEAQVRRARLPAHLAPVFGAALARLGAPAEDAARLFLFHQARGVASAAVRLGLVGPTEAQVLLARAGPASEAARERSRGVDPEDAAATSPLLELLQSHHDRLYSRLFQS